MISLVDHVFIKSDLTVVLLIDIQVLNQALVKEVFKVSGVKKNVLQNMIKIKINYTLYCMEN